MRASRQPSVHDLDRPPDSPTRLRRLSRRDHRSAASRIRTARAHGYLFHLGLGVLFAIAYAGLFTVIGRSSWWLGALVGVLHGIFTSTILVNVLLPIVHPRMGTVETAANEIALIEPPGFLMLNYGRNTFLVTLAAHIAYGAIVGWAVRI